MKKSKTASIVSQRFLDKMASSSVLKSLAKWTKGLINIEALAQTLTPLGWAFQKSSQPIFIDGEQLRGFLWKQHRLNVFISGSGKDGDVHTLNSDPSTKAEILRALNPVFTSSPPSPSEEGAFYFQKLNYEDRKLYDKLVPSLEIGKVWYGAPSVEVTSPSGTKGVFPAKMSTGGGVPDLNNFKNAAFWKFLYSEGLQEQAQALVDGDPSLLRSPSMRTLENTGTCQICLRNVKLRGGVIVDHGFQNPKYYQGRSRSCYGTNHQPLELSNDACKRYLTALQSNVRELEERRTKALSGYFEEPLKGRDGKPLEEGTPAYERAVKIYLAGLESNIKHCLADIKEMSLRIPNWSERPLP